MQFIYLSIYDIYLSFKGEEKYKKKGRKKKLYKKKEKKDM